MYDPTKTVPDWTQDELTERYLNEISSDPKICNRCFKEWGILNPLDAEDEYCYECQEEMEYEEI